MREYHLHRDDYTKLQLEINLTAPYIARNDEHCFVPHRHSFYQLIWFKRPGTHFVDYKEFEHPGNSLFFLTVGQVHCFSRDSNNEGYLYHFNDIFLHAKDKSALSRMRYNIFDDFKTPYVSLPGAELSDFQYTTDKIRGEIESKNRDYREHVYFHFRLLLLKIERLKQKGETHTLSDPHFEVAMKFRDAVEKSVHEFKNIEYFSKLIGVSEKTLSASSKKYLNATPADFIRMKKVLEAKRLLSSSRLSIKEIAYQLGFEQQTYFTKYFKKYVSATPKEFQSHIRRRAVGSK